MNVPACFHSFSLFEPPEMLTHRPLVGIENITVHKSYEARHMETKPRSNREPDSRLSHELSCSMLPTNLELPT